MHGSIGSSMSGGAQKTAAFNSLDYKLKQMRYEADASNAVDAIQVEQSQTQMDIMQIIKKYGGAGADASWVNELSAIEKKQQAKPSYLESNESESVASSIQEEAYQKIRQKYQTAV